MTGVPGFSRWSDCAKPAEAEAPTFVAADRLEPAELLIELVNKEELPGVRALIEVQTPASSGRRRPQGRREGSCLEDHGS